MTVMGIGSDPAVSSSVSTMGSKTSSPRSVGMAQKSGSTSSVRQSWPRYPHHPHDRPRICRDVTGDIAPRIEPGDEVLCGHDRAYRFIVTQRYALLAELDLVVPPSPPEHLHLDRLHTSPIPQTPESVQWWFGQHCLEDVLLSAAGRDPRACHEDCCCSSGGHLSLSHQSTAPSSKSRLNHEQGEPWREGAIASPSATTRRRHLPCSHASRHRGEVLS